MFISKYNNFVLESKIYNLLLEGKLEMAPRFIKILDEIASRSRLGKDISGFINANPEIPDADLKQNYISLVPDKTDTISFMPQSKFNAYVKLFPDESLTPFKIVKGRTEVKVGRFLKVICDMAKITYVDKEMEEVVNLFKSLNVNENEKMYLVEGDDIKEWYSNKKYLNRDGELGNSCMRYDECQSYFKIYTKNPEKVKMLILTTKVDDEEKLLGRAIVWSLDESPCGPITFLDRVYSSKDSDKLKFFSYADKNGWLKKNYNAGHGDTKFKLGDKVFKGKVLVSGLKGNYKNFPYVDTLNFLSHDKSQMSNVGFIKGYDMCETDGGLDTCSNCNGTGIEICSYCDGSGFEDCNDCYGAKTLECPDCYGKKTMTEECPSCSDSNWERGQVDCEECHGEGKVLSKKSGKEIRCKSCKTTGHQSCQECNGTGDVEIPCVECSGKGRVKCDECDGKGRIKCDECKGKKEECSECVGILNSK